MADVGFGVAGLIARFAAGGGAEAAAGAGLITQPLVAEEAKAPAEIQMARQAALAEAARLAGGGRAGGGAIEKGQPLEAAPAAVRQRRRGGWCCSACEPEAAAERASQAASAEAARLAAEAQAAGDEAARIVAELVAAESKAEDDRVAAVQQEAAAERARQAASAEAARVAAEAQAAADAAAVHAAVEAVRVAAPAGIDPSSDARFIQLFGKLYAASPQFRGHVAAIEGRYGKPILVREMQMTADEFEFDACWRWECHIEIRTAGMTDAEIGGLIAFETTNGYQTAAFDRINEEFQQATASSPRPVDGGGPSADQGSLFLQGMAGGGRRSYPPRGGSEGSPQHQRGCEGWPEDPATDYANKMETIEQQGIDLCKAVLREAMAHDESITEDWCRYGNDDTRSWYRIGGMGALAQEYYDTHFEYWRQSCINTIMAGYPDKASYLSARAVQGGHPPRNPDAATPYGGAGGAAPSGTTQQMAWLCARRAAAGAPPVPVLQEPPQAADVSDLGDVRAAFQM